MHGPPKGGALRLAQQLRPADNNTIYDTLVQQERHRMAFSS
jgi:hypothetical protein